MAEEVKNVETQAAPTNNETPAPAPREDFDTMTIEELTKYVETPLERVNQPNEKAMNDIMYEIPSRPDVTKCVVTKDTIEKGRQPKLVSEQLPEKCS